MAPKRSGPPHAAAKLVQLAGAAGDAHSAITEHQAAAVAAHVAAMQEGRRTKQQRRADRLAAIEERNKHATAALERH